MTVQKHIDSTKNSTIRELVLIKEKSRWRKKTGKFVLEGFRELGMALKSGYHLDTVFFDPGIRSLAEIEEMTFGLTHRPEYISVSREVYRRIAYREKTEGVVALGVAKKHHLDDMHFRRDKPVLLVGESLEKPGNIGALLRTADAAALDGVILANPRTDLYNPNIIRSSLGCVFSMPVALAENTEVLAFLHRHKIQIIAAELGASSVYSETNYLPASALVVGAESTGLSPFWLREADRRVIIPMRGEIDSMNVSVSAAILIFEAMRQRGFH